MKKQFAVSLILLLVLAGCGPQPTEPTPSQVPSQKVQTPEPSAQPESPAPVSEAEQTFDPALAGRWNQVTKMTEENGEISIDGIDYKLFPSYFSFLPDGIWLNGVDSEDAYTDYIELGVEPLRATTEGGLLHLIDLSYQAELDAGLATPEEIEKLPQVNVAYELSDIEEASNTSDGDRAWYEMCDNDLLTLHITGTQVDSQDPSRVYTIDTTLVYERQYPTYYGGCLRPALVGEWSDSNGNHWTFGYEKDDAGEYKFVFSGISAADGKTYAGDRIQGWRNEKGEEGFWFVLENGDKSPEYRIISYDGAVFHMVDKHNEEYTLSRQP